MLSHQFLLLSANEFLDGFPYECRNGTELGQYEHGFDEELIRASRIMV